MLCGKSRFGDVTYHWLRDEPNSAQFCHSLTVTDIVDEMGRAGRGMEVVGKEEGKEEEEGEKEEEIG